MEEEQDYQENNFWTRTEMPTNNNGRLKEICANLSFWQTSKVETPLCHALNNLGTQINPIEQRAILYITLICIDATSATTKNKRQQYFTALL